MSFFQRLDVIALAILFAYVVVAVIYVTHRIRCVSAAQTGGSGPRHPRIGLAADLGAWVRTLKSVAHVAPFLGLAGVCEGIFAAFYPYAGVIGIAAALSGSLITTAGGLIVAVPAAWSYNHLR